MPAHSADAAPPRVLLAEDDYEFRRLLKGALGREGFEVHAVQTGHALLGAIREICQARERAPAVIISDQCMPGGVRGLDVFNYARQLGWTLPMVLITAYEDEAILDEAARAGVVVVHKPFDVDDVCTMARFLAAGGSKLPH